MSNFFESDLKDITRLILVRHGRTNNNIDGRFGSLDDVPLDDVGRDQAKRAAQKLLEFDINHIYSSSLQRAKETAEIIVKDRSLKITIRSELNEYNNGVIAGLSIDEVQQKFPNVYADLQNWIKMGPTQKRKRFMAPGMENMDDFRERIISFQNSILSDHPGQIVLAVTHLAVIKGFMTLLSGGSFNSQMNYLADNASITVIDYFLKIPVLRLFNENSHLGIKLKYGKVTAF